MKRFLILLLLTIFSCNKSSDVTSCYECDLNTGGYVNVGCMTNEQWANFHPVDAMGQPVDKDTKCRKK